MDRKTMLGNLWVYIRTHLVLSIILVLFCAGTAAYAVADSLGTAPDETFHYAIIKDYAKQYSPIVTYQSDVSVASANDIVRLPSYLYHYIMSFPYRLLVSAGLSDHSVLVALRLLNIPLGVVAIVLLRKLLGRLTTGWVADTATAAFALLPITLVMYGGLNYDNLLLPLVFGSLLLLLSIHERPTVHKVVGLLTMLEVGAITKFTVMPLAFVICTYLAWLVVCRRAALWQSLRYQSRGFLAVIVCLLVLMTGLFVERYGTNIIAYHAMNPPCESQHSLQVCLTFPLNQRNYTAAHSGIPTTHNVVVYAADDWYKNMVRGLIYPSNLLFLRYVFLGFVLLAAGAVLAYRRGGYVSRHFGRVLLGISLFYAVTVFVNNYHEYLVMGQAYAINGRYLLPAMPLLLVPALTNITVLCRESALAVSGGLSWLGWQLETVYVYVREEVPMQLRFKRYSDDD